MDQIVAIANDLLATREDGAFYFPDAAVPRLMSAYAQVESAEDFERATVDIFAFARYLAEEKRSPEAAGTIVSMVRLAIEIVRKGQSQELQAAARQAEAQARGFKDFSGDQRVKQALDSGQRPAGTTPAGPLARFQLDRDDKR